MKRHTETEVEYLFKVVLIGDSSVGKTKIQQRFLHNTFNAESKATIGVEFSSKTIRVENNLSVRAQIWDTAGQEQYRALVPSYYRDAAGALLVFDLTSNNSFTNAQRWLSELREKSDDSVVVLLVGNKSDLKESRKVPFEEASTWAEKMHLAYIETSALDGSNVEIAFCRLVQEIYRQKKEEENDRTQNKFHNMKYESSRGTSVL